MYNRAGPALVADEAAQVATAVAVAVDVIAPVIVAALGNGNDTVGVIDVVSEDATGGWERPIARACSASTSGRTTRADKAMHYTIARGSAMEFASHLDVMRVDEWIDAELYARGIEMLERCVAMLTRLIEP